MVIAEAVRVQVCDLLVIDDDPLVLEVVELAVTMDRPDATVITADGPAAALDLLASQTPRIVVTDFDMRGMNGARLIQEIRSSNAAQPILVFTGRSADDVIPRIPADVFVIEKSSPKSIIKLRDRITLILDGAISAA